MTKVNKAPIFHDINSELKEKLNILPHTSNRLKCCLKFSWHLSGDEDIMKCSKEEVETLREGYMRASLAEYASIEETLKRDVTGLPNTPSPLLIRDIQHPLPHLLKELRNLEIHVVSSTLSSNEVKGFVQWGPGEIQNHEYTNHIVDDFSLSKFKRSSNSKFYDDNDIKKAIEWFNTVQQVFGIGEVIRIGVEVMAKTLIDQYNLG